MNDQTTPTQNSVVIDSREAVVSTIPERCKRCYCCVRECPARAIQIIGGQAVVLNNRCVGCGNCIKVCTQNAKAVRDGLHTVRIALADNSKRRERIVILAPSFPAAFPEYEPRRIIGALRELGFTLVLEVAFGADLVSAEYQKLISRSSAPLITTPCPAVVEYIEKYYPQLIPSLAPVVSPMIALGHVARERYGAKSHITFIGPCVAKKLEIIDPECGEVIDEALTFNELETLFNEEGIDLSTCPERDFDQPRANLGQIYPISGGLLKSAELSSDVMDREVIVVEGRQRCVNIINEIAQGKVNVRLIDILFCEGCINGPGMHHKLNFYEKRERIIDFVSSSISDLNKAIWRNSIKSYAHLPMSRKYRDRSIDAPLPTDEDIQRSLEKMDKGSKADQLNCGACGYESCREMAAAVAQGLAEPEMCLPYTIDNLEKSHRELAEAQEQLIHSEKLASVGQLAAGVAHEINNPLGTILLYSHLLRKQLGEDNPAEADVSFIIEEAERCKNIVASLLNFARQGKLTVNETTAGELLHTIVAMLERREETKSIQMDVEIDPGLPVLYIDVEQMKQVLLNIAINACEAMPEGGKLRMIAKLGMVPDELCLQVIDTGMGIPKENMPRLFTPFFTTKQIGKGTGLGLPIAYGIVKMHHGQIAVQSEPGKGTAFTITIPIDVRTRPSERMTPPDFAAALAASITKSTH
jgi:iron only hydrogenase large subunit-like protein/nitrogen-specific signal transduction histidine kinase